MAEGVKRGRGNEDGDNYSKVQKTDKMRVKFLVPIYTAGAIIGEKGAEIKKLKEETSAQVHISEVNEFFPGTRERVVLCSGSFTSVLEVFKRINHKLRHEELPDKKGTLTQRQSDYAEKRRTIMKVLVPASIAGQVVGKKGETVKKIQDDCSVKIDVTPNHKAIFNLNERAVDVTGEEESVNGVGARLLTMLSEDPEARMSGSLIYSGYCTPDDMDNQGQQGGQWSNQQAAQGGYNQGSNWGGNQQGGFGGNQGGYGGNQGGNWGGNQGGGYGCNQGGGNWGHSQGSGGYWGNNQGGSYGNQGYGNQGYSNQGYGNQGGNWNNNSGYGGDQSGYGNQAQNTNSVPDATSPQGGYGGQRGRGNSRGRGASAAANR